jgi:hypothetical protein
MQDSGMNPFDRTESEPEEALGYEAHRNPRKSKKDKGKYRKTDVGGAEGGAKRRGNL